MLKNKLYLAIVKTYNVITVDDEPEYYDISYKLNIFEYVFDDFNKLKNLYEMSIKNDSFHSFNSYEVLIGTSTGEIIGILDIENEIFER